jgi:hypothetical protein
MLMLTTSRVESDSQIECGGRSDIGLWNVFGFGGNSSCVIVSWPCCLWCWCIVIVKRRKRCNSVVVLADGDRVWIQEAVMDRLMGDGWMFHPPWCATSFDVCFM